MSMILLADIDPRQARMLEIAELLLTKLKTEEGFEATLSFLRLDIKVFMRLGKYDEGI